MIFIDVVLSGIIPACAGSTSYAYTCPMFHRDHPRMCGEHLCPVNTATGEQGSSPHVRGARSYRVHHSWLAGIIPACAGSTPGGLKDAVSLRDHPRMCGEHRTAYREPDTNRGSSPHVRGAHIMVKQYVDITGIIPACAGSTTSAPSTRLSARDHPRMCGEHPKMTALAFGSPGSSPHVRGAHFENSIIPRKRKDNWLFFIQFRFENFLAFRYLLALLHPFLGVPTKDPSFASLGRLINCNPSQSTGDQSAPYTLKAICCSFLAE